MKYIISILLAISIFFGGVNSCAFAKKNAISNNSITKERTQKEKVKKTKVKKEKVKKEKVKKEKQPKVEKVKKEKTKTEKIKKTKTEKPKKQKPTKEEQVQSKPVKEKKVKEPKLKKNKKSTKMAESLQEQKVSVQKPKKVPGRIYSEKELKSMTQVEREKALVDEQFRYRQRSALAMKLNPNLDVIEIRAKHILVKKRKDAIAIRKDILNGTITFEEAAMQYSLCPTGVKGGDLGYFNRKRMDQNFADRAFDLKIGTISEPVGTKFGWHLIMVTDKR